MSTHVGGFFATWSSEPSADDGHADAQAVSTLGNWVAVANNGGPGGFSGQLGPNFMLAFNGGIAAATCGRGGSRVRTPAFGQAGFPGSVVMWQGYIQDDLGVRYAAWTIAGTTEWTIEGARVDNFGAQSIINPDRAPPSSPLLRLLGLGPIGGQPTFFQGVATIAYPGGGAYFGRSHFTEFIESPPNAFDSPVQALQRIRQQLAAPSHPFVLGTTSGGVERSLADCDYAGLDAAGVLWIRPEDIGNLVEQIPSELAQNSAQHFRFYPNAFFRRSRYVSGLHAPYTDTTSIDAPGPELDPGLGPTQPYVLRVVNFTPTNSTWLLVLDGQPVCVRINHPQGSDLRRPDEIWNGAIVPLIQQAQGPSTAALVDRIFPFNIFGDTGGLIDRLKYVQFARMLALFDDSGDFDLTDIPQGQGGVN